MTYSSNPPNYRTPERLKNYIIKSLKDQKH